MIDFLKDNALYIGGGILGLILVYYVAKAIFKPVMYLILVMALCYGGYYAYNNYSS